MWIEYLKRRKKTHRPYVWYGKEDDICGTVAVQPLQFQGKNWDFGLPQIPELGGDDAARDTYKFHQCWHSTYLIACLYWYWYCCFFGCILFWSKWLLPCGEIQPKWSVLPVTICQFLPLNTVYITVCLWVMMKMWNFISTILCNSRYFNPE